MGATPTALIPNRGAVMARHRGRLRPLALFLGVFLAVLLPLECVRLVADGGLGIYSLMMEACLALMLAIAAVMVPAIFKS